MSFLEGTFARLQLGRPKENEADFMAGRAVDFTKQVSYAYPKSETAMAADLALLCQKHKLDPSELITDLLKTGRHKELIATAKYVCTTQGIGPLDENGEIRVENSEDVVPMVRLLFSYTENLMKIESKGLQQLVNMYGKFTTYMSLENDLEYRRTAERMIDQVMAPRVGVLAT